MRRRRPLCLRARKEGTGDNEQEQKLWHTVYYPREFYIPTVAHPNFSPPKNCRRRCSELLMAIYFYDFFFLLLNSVQTIWRIQRSTKSFFGIDSKRQLWNKWKDSPRFKYQVCFLHSANRVGESPSPSDLCSSSRKVVITMPPPSLGMNIDTVSSGHTVGTQCVFISSFHNLQESFIQAFSEHL